MFQTGPAYLSVQEQFVCSRKYDNFPLKPRDLVGHTVRVTARSSYVETLKRYQQKIPDLKFIEEEDYTTEMLLAEAAELKGCVVADSNIVTKTQRLFPDLRVGFSFPGKHELGWYLPADARELATLTRNWMKSKEGKLAIAEMNNVHYSYISDFDLWICRF